MGTVRMIPGGNDMSDELTAEMARAKEAEAANAADIAAINKELDGVADALAAI